MNFAQKQLKMKDGKTLGELDGRECNMTELLSSVSLEDWEELQINLSKGKCSGNSGRVWPEGALRGDGEK